MPSDQSTWLISAPQDGDSEGLKDELERKFQSQLRSFDRNSLVQVPIPVFKVRLGLKRRALLFNESQTGTLAGLINLSEDLVKQDAYFTQTTAKIVETIRNLLNNEQAKVLQHTQVNDVSVDDYLRHWRWNEGRYIVHKDLKDIVETMNKVRRYDHSFFLSVLMCV